ncbi:hypothetical protein [Bacillus sp. FJAT-29937]|uniref:hypothetical protein n=1 Tax=Bacillus sp. FJAT-29937 TaxID=1720553 RepID=UPI00082B7A80|nr:hypothetical protein [Bacillus sp. FJAT-29937]
MKMIQLVGSRNKADFALYFSHVLTNLENRVLLVDATADQIYRHGYTRLGKNEHVFDFQGIDIMGGASNWLQVEEHLREINETTTNYDVVIIDMDSIEAITAEWPHFDDRFYVGDEERLNQVRDVELLHRLFDETESTEIKRITFEGRYKLEGSYFDTLMSNRAKWVSIPYSIELDEMEGPLRTQMQHEQSIPFKKLTKQYRETLTEMVSALFEVHVEEVQSAVKTSFFRFGRKKKEATQFADSNI